MTRLARYRPGPDGPDRVGVADGEQVRPLPGVTDVVELAGWEPGEIRSAVADQPGVPLAEVELRAPIDRPVRNLFCVGWNYLAHFEEGRAARPEVALPPRPTLFSKATGVLAGPYDRLPTHRPLTSQLDWEVELAVVIGTGGSDIPAETALAHVFGYLVANDVTGRDLQAGYGGQWLKGKSLDRTCPIGPVLVTADELADPQQLTLACRVNDRTVQSASTSQMIFPVARVIAELSAGLTLLPGDIILTGTPEGVGHQRTPPEYLQPGDVLESEIAGIGALRNVIE